MCDAWTHDDIIQHLIRQAGSRDTVRAILLTSTRAMPGAKIDAWSDYDVILVPWDIHSFVADRTGIDAFGRVLVT